MSARRRTSEVYNEILGGKDQQWLSIAREVIELVEATFRWDKAEMLLEFQQVLYALQMQAYQLTGIDFQLWGCSSAVEGFYTRRKVWFEIFEEFQVPFKNEYLENGSNYKRAYKIKKALELAGVNIDTKKAVQLCLKYTNK
jgi:hypothetical protein